jgi:hypothetical protein
VSEVFAVARVSRWFPARLVLAALVVVVSFLAARATVAGAGLIGSTLGTSCPPTSTPFLPWGDGARYFPVNGGSFENGASGWTLSGGATVVAGNEPFHAAGAGDRVSLSLPSGSSATSPDTCIALLTPALRFFAVDRGSDSGLRVRIVFRGLLGNVLGVLDSTTLAPQPSWGPTPRALFGGSSLTVPLGTKSFRVQLTPSGSGSAWQVDDLYIDPILCR